MFNFYGVYSGILQVPAKTDVGVAFLPLYSIDRDLNIARCLNATCLLSTMCRSVISVVSQDNID